jgi:hypothetical protein
MIVAMMINNNGTTTAATITPTLFDDEDWDAGVGNFAAMVVEKV